MGNQELAIRYSNEKYCTKNEISEILKTPLIDPIWNSVLEYRANFALPLTLKHINGSYYNVCLTPIITQEISSIERNFFNLEKNYFKLNGYDEQKLFNTRSLKKCLRKIAFKYSINVEDDVIENIINGNISGLSPELKILVKYLNCLNAIKENNLDGFDDNCVSLFYSNLIGTTELTKYYRKNQLEDDSNRYAIGKLYLGVPSEQIESNMEQLFEFVKNSSISSFIKAIAAFYFIYYIKPFDEYTEEIAVLTFKKVLSICDYENVASIMDFESLLDDKEGLEKAIIESQRNLDLTYLVRFIYLKCTSIFSEVSNELVLSQKEIINQEIHQPEETNILNNLNNSVTNQTPSFAGRNDESINYTQNIAIGNVPTGLEENQASLLENHLMELNPNLSRGQAYFYARHCTLGMTYTISQYKKCLNCAYETARSSMDNLVSLGYYRKEVLKNKYIYTPIKKG